MIDQDIKKFVLRRLLQKSGEPATATELKLAIRSAFNAAFTEGDLDSYLAQMEEDNYIAGTKDDLSGTLWALTGKGKNPRAATHQDVNERSTINIRVAERSVLERRGDVALGGAPVRDATVASFAQSGDTARAGGYHFEASREGAFKAHCEL